MPETWPGARSAERAIRRPLGLRDGEIYLRLIAFPPAGASASVFRAWPDWLPPDIELWPVQLPGRQDRLREAPFTGVAPLVRSLAAELMLPPDERFALFGHSMGALVAFELARELRRRGGPRPSRLFVTSCRAPQLPRPQPLLGGLPDDALIYELRRLGGIPEEVVRDRELLDLIIPALRADVTLLERYVYAAEEPLAVPISAFGGWRDRSVNQADLSAWRAHTAAGFELRMLDGGHFLTRSGERQLVGAIVDHLRHRHRGGQLDADPASAEVAL
jgi:medium-chain acyl-[acyl-carrier-protein] hydrolase